MQNYFQNYYNNFNVFQRRITTPPSNALKTVVVLPSCNETTTNQALISLLNCETPKNPTEIIVVVNSSEKASQQIIETNLKTVAQINEIAKTEIRKNITVNCIYIDNMPKKHAGVGMARKIGMDEAIRRFDAIQNPDGVIVNYDADCTCNKQYLIEIEKKFTSNPKLESCSIWFEHPLEGNIYPPELYNAIAQYELHLRTYLALTAMTGFPYAYQTLGSAFAVRAKTYCLEGGMNRRQAGEDFYFLHKIIPRGHHTNLNTAIVYPSPRISDRVPFGTGAAIGKMVSQNNTNAYLAFNPIAFEQLESFFYSAISSKGENLVLSNTLEEFLLLNNYQTTIKNIKANSTNEKTFARRFFAWFDAFKILKYMHFAHLKEFSQPTVVEVAQYLLKKLGFENSIKQSPKELVLTFREIEKKGYVF